MDFYKSFAFCHFVFSRERKTDNSAGTAVHHIGWVHSGSAEFVTETERMTFSAGDAFYIPPGCRYRSVWHGEPKIAFDSYAFTYLPAAFGITYKLQKLHTNAQTEAILANLSAAVKDKCLAVGYLYTLLGLLLPTMQPEKRNTRALTVTKAQSYMHAHPDFTVPEAAKHCGVSTPALYAAFRQTVGHTPIAEKHRQQTEYAILLLSTTDFSVEEISFRAGFGSVAYFRKVLKDLTGKTPREYRRAESL